MSEQLLFSTVRLEVQTSEGVSKGTAFFFEMTVGTEGETCPMMFTNKHMVKGAISGRMVLLDGDPNATPRTPSGVVHTVSGPNFGSVWTHHPSDDVDLCGAPLGVTIKQLLETGHNVFRSPFHPKHVPSQEQLTELSAVEEVLMAGYPLGMYDEKHNLPLLRRGTTATHPALDYGGKPWGVVDMACFPGSSGSPIVICNEGTFVSKHQGMMLGNRFYLLGVLFGGPTRTIEGEIVIRDIPTAQKVFAQSQQMIHLGYYVKAREILTLANIMLANAGLSAK